MAVASGSSGFGLSVGSKLFYAFVAVMMGSMLIFFFFVYDSGSEIKNEGSIEQPPDFSNLEDGEPLYKAPKVPPNIILILTDDQDITTTTLEYMPNVRKHIQEKGMTFTNGFATSPLCAPSRASILRGQYTHNHGLLSHIIGYRVFISKENDTAAVWLKKAGYKTALFGKYFNGYGLMENEHTGHMNLADTSAAPGWDRWYATIRGNYYNPVVSDDGKMSKTVGYGTDLLTEKAIEWVYEHFKREENEIGLPQDLLEGPSEKAPPPFFLYIAPKAPHRPYSPAERHNHLFYDVSCPHPPNFNPRDDIQDKKPYPLDKSPFLTWKVDILDDVHRQRLRTLVAVDELVDKLVNVLEELDIINNTYIFYTSDNGYSMGEHRIAQEKTTNYEEALRVPFLVRGPGIPQNKVVHDIALNIDLAPTWAELAGATIPDFVDGVSLVPILLQREQKIPKREVFVAENYEPPYAGLFKEQHGLRILTEDGKYNLMYTIWDGNRSECYNINEDRYELANACFDMPMNQLHSVTPLWDLLSSCSGPTCRNLRSLAPLCLKTPFGPIKGCVKTSLSSSSTPLSLSTKCDIAPLNCDEKHPWGE